MSKNKYYVIAGILALITIFAQIAFSQQYSHEKLIVIERLKDKGDDPAIKLAEEYLASNPGDVDIINLLAETYVSRDNLTKAEETAKKAIAIQPNNPWSRRLLAKTYRLKAQEDPGLAEDNLTLALQQVKEGLGSNPNDPNLLVEAAEIYSGLGDKIKANEAIDLAIAIRPNDNSLKNMKESMGTSRKWGKEKVEE